MHRTCISCVCHWSFPHLLPHLQDATANDLPKGDFDVQGFPTMYFRSASGNLSQYNGERTKEAIIEFIENNRDKPAQSDSAKVDSAKDEL
uniref:Protein disulfide isomerase n=1 Tax=Solanum tuberosum TaxID=4113 RepID=M0ZYC3_SOLTU